MVLKELLNSIDQNFSIARASLYENLRKEVKSMDLPTFIDEVNKIEETSHIRLLWGAGLNSDQQRHAGNRLDELLTRPPLS